MNRGPGDTIVRGHLGCRDETREAIALSSVNRSDRFTQAISLSASASLQECVDNRGIEPVDANDFAIPTNVCLDQCVRSRAELSFSLQFENSRALTNLVRSSA